MPRIERSNLSLIDKKIRENESNPKIAKVEQVYEHVAPDDDSNFEADVSLPSSETGEDRIEQKCPILNPGSNSIDIPTAEDKVLLTYTDEENPKPHITEIAWTNKDRPPVGKAGMWRREVDGGESPLGQGNLYVTSHTEYEEAAANHEKGARGDIVGSTVQIAKHKSDNNIIPTEQTPIPAKIELYESPVSQDDEAHIHLDANTIDQDGALGLDVFLDMKAGVLTVRGDSGGDSYKLEIDVKSKTASIKGDSNAGNKMGADFNFASNEFKIADGNKFGIKSDGNGDFTWSHKNIDYVQESSGSINL